MIAVVDYGMSNLGSLINMLKKAGHKAVLARSPDELENAEKAILPGVGAFGRGMESLHAGGWVPALERHAIERGRPLLGVCLGMQLLTGHSEEGDVPGLGLVPGRTRRFRAPADMPEFRIPHMGWNRIDTVRDHPLVSGADEQTRFYFAHGYHVECDEVEDVVAVTDYGYRFPSIIARDNIWGVQFHPEKSHRFGLSLLRNFADS